MRLWDRVRTVAHDRRVLGFAVAAGLLLSARAIADSPMSHLDRQLLDYRVFWCGGQAALAGADPYRTEPLRTCEHAVAAQPVAASPNLVMPFVLPPYDVPALEALARLPFGPSGALFTALGVLALAIAVVLVALSVRVPVALSAAALGMSVGLPSLVLGQTVPLELLAVAATGFALSRRRDAWAGAGAAVTMLAPHVGVFVVVTVALLVPRARVALAAALAALALVAVLLGRAGAPAAYLALLARHAAAEARAAEQYSLTYALAFVHVPVGLALAFGIASTFVMLAAGVLLSRAALSAGLRSAAAYLPAACAVLGGTFVHVTQIALAAPAALLLFRHAPSRPARALGAAAVVLLAIPWPYPVLVKQALAPALVVLAVTAWYAFGGRLRWTLAAVVACWLLLIPIENRPPPAPPVAVLARAPSDVSASVPWGQALAQRPPPAARDLLVKLPTWAGLLAVIAAALVLARTARPARFTSVANAGPGGDDAT